MSHNRYLYAHGNPLINTDPNGRAVCEGTRCDGPVTGTTESGVPVVGLSTREKAEVQTAAQQAFAVPSRADRGALEPRAQRIADALEQAGLPGTDHLLIPLIQSLYEQSRGQLGEGDSPFDAYLKELQRIAGQGKTTEAKEFALQVGLELGGITFGPTPFNRIRVRPDVIDLGVSGWRMAFVDDDAPSIHLSGFLAVGYRFPGEAGRLALRIQESETRDGSSMQDVLLGAIGMGVGRALHANDISVKEAIVAMAALAGDPRQGDLSEAQIQRMWEPSPFHPPICDVRSFVWC